MLSSTVFQVGWRRFWWRCRCFFPQKLVTQIVYEVTPIAAPETSVPLPPKPPVVRAARAAHAAAVEQPEPVHVAKLIAPRALVAPKPKPVEVKTEEAPKVDQPFIEAKFEAPWINRRVRANR